MLQALEPPIRLYRWRDASPAPCDGWYSNKEAFDFLAWARYEVSTILDIFSSTVPLESTVQVARRAAHRAGTQAPIHPHDVLPLPKPFEFNENGFRFTREKGAIAYNLTKVRGYLSVLLPM